MEVKETMGVTETVLLLVLLGGALFALGRLSGRISYRYGYRWGYRAGWHDRTRHDRPALANTGWIHLDPTAPNLGRNTGHHRRPPARLARVARVPAQRPQSTEES